MRTPLKFPLSRDEVRRELTRRAVLYILEADNFDEATADAAIDRAAAELEREIVTHYATIENVVRQIEGQVPH